MSCPSASRSSLHDLRMPFDVCSHAKEGRRHTASKLRISIVCQRDFRVRAVVKGQVYRGLTVDHSPGQCHVNCERPWPFTMGGVFRKYTAAKISVTRHSMPVLRASTFAWNRQIPMDYDFQAIEKRWKAQWKADGCLPRRRRHTSRPKYYVLDMFPYPSGARVCTSATLWAISQATFSRGTSGTKGSTFCTPWATTVLVLPAEQYAIQTGQHPGDHHGSQHRSGTGSSWSNWGSATTGRVKCGPAIPAILPLDAVDFWRACSNPGMMREARQRLGLSPGADRRP